MERRGAERSVSMREARISCILECLFEAKPERQRISKFGWVEGDQRRYRQVCGEVAGTKCGANVPGTFYFARCRVIRV